MLHIAGCFDVISLSGHSPVVQMKVTNVVGTCTSVTSIWVSGRLHVLPDDTELH